jgi:hypothetical protein
VGFEVGVVVLIEVSVVHGLHARDLIRNSASRPASSTKNRGKLHLSAATKVPSPQDNEYCISLLMELACFVDLDILTFEIDIILADVLIYIPHFLSLVPSSYPSHTLSTTLQIPSYTAGLSHR